MASTYYELHTISSTPFPITNDVDNAKLHVYIVTLATATVNLPSATGFNSSSVHRYAMRIGSSSDRRPQLG